MSTPTDIANWPDFRPLPLLGNPHLQTLLAYCLPGPQVGRGTREQVLRLPDGDGLMLYDNVPPGWQPGQRMVVLIHGLTGWHASPQIQRLAVGFLGHGLRVVRIDLRGVGKGLPLARGFYHSGRSEDIRAVVHEVHSWSPASPITLVGVSLGGNLVLKTAGEAVLHPVPRLQRVVALNPPIDLERCSTLLAQPRNRFYDFRFARDLLANARQRQRHFPDPPLPRFPSRLTVRLFDELY